ncbi:MAG: 4,5-DOPA dioxygenase extradiol [Candidatus Sericytochromatia bacterium]
MVTKMPKMPVLFVGHGSPMNAIENNAFTQSWKSLPNKIPTPKAILVISAHWYTKGTRILTAKNPIMTYDMYGFPDALYQIVYDSKGSPELAAKTANLLDDIDVIEDNTWGYDHGNWSILHIMYPKRDISVYQLSIDKTLSPEKHFEIGKKLSSLREEGVLILSSGNVVHNLRTVNFSMENGGYKEAILFDQDIKEKIINKDYDEVINFNKNKTMNKLAFETPEHYLPLLYSLGATSEEDNVEVFNEAYVYGSLSMTSYLWN